MAITNPIANISDYINEDGHQLMYQAVLGSTLENYGITVLRGIKGSQKIPFLTIDNKYTYGSGCNITATSSVNTTQLTVTAYQANSRTEICYDTFQTKFYKNGMKQGSVHEDGGTLYKDTFIAALQNTVSYDFGKMLLLGSLTGTFSSKFNGNTGVFSDILETSKSSQLIQAGTASTQWTLSTAIDIVDDMFLKRHIDTTERKDNIILCGRDKLDIYALAWRKLNNVHIFPEDDNSMKIPGTNITMIGDPVLNGFNKAILTYAANIIKVTDLESEEDRMESFYDPRTKTVVTDSVGKIGGYVYDATKVVIWNK